MTGDDGEEATGAMIVLPLERLARLVRAREHEGGLNPAQWEALRFLARANRFSNSPGALTRYLGATKGTVSQTVMALERKGYITKSSRAGKGRSVSLTLTPRGIEALTQDPWATLAAAADELGGKTRRRLHRGLSELLADELARQGLAGFGVCSSCRFFRERGGGGEPRAPHFCMFFEESLSDEDGGRICVAHEPRP
jgi:DNA-binding MarR family transcriptional regulator